jgi:hypothetical protein
MLKHVAIAVLFAVLGALAWIAPPHVLGKVTHNHGESHHELAEGKNIA